MERQRKGRWRQSLPVRHRLIRFDHHQRLSLGSASRDGNPALFAASEEARPASHLMPMKSTGQLTSSPVATGGAGTFFEQHVAAYWFAQLLVRGIPPILIDTVVAEVHFQTEHLGWQTDDFLVVCERAGTGTRKLVGQVKLDFTVSNADDACRRAIQDFWRDFKNSDRFSQQNDRLVLVTSRGTNTLLKDFVGLLDTARAANDSTDFERRLATRGFISAKSVHYCIEVQKILDEYEGQPVQIADVWPFLRVLHVLSLDLHSSSRQTEAHIKSLLAYTVEDGEALSVADASWNALLAIASTAMAEARSFRRDDLPDELRQRHGALNSNEQRVLRILREHTDLILRGIRSTIGPELHLHRSEVVQKVIAELQTAQVVLVSGPAGSGKSAIGKNAVALLSETEFVFGFRVEEFAQPHFDATLSAAQVPANATTLGAILAAQSRKIVLIESVERLLERTTRDAFSDLMTLAAGDGGMRFVLTCRDYSIQQVLASFLRPAGITNAIVEVPPFRDDELTEVEAALPALAYPLMNPALRNILRNPYFLDKALAISWSQERSLPESEREFRVLFWREIVRADQRSSPGTARRREEVFQTVAIRRARALSPYVLCNDLDPDVLGALRHDSLLDSSREHPLHMATAHDVLEDWAILQRIEELHLTADGSFAELSTAIGPYPAIRRAYRKWVAELVERDPPAADRLFNAAITETEISGYFRDDTLVSLLKAPLSPVLLSRHEAQLLANERALLKRVVHLLRVACVAPPAWLSDIPNQGSVFNVPEGPSWAAVLRLVHNNIDAFTPHDRPLLLALIEDAVRGVSWWAPRLEGEEAVAGIGHWLLPRFGSYDSDEARKRVLRVIAKIPQGDVVRFETVLRGTVDSEQRLDRVAEEFQEILLGGIDGMAAARDLPDVLLSVANDYLLATEESAKRDLEWGSSSDLGTYFGIREGLRHDFFPASAFRGPWIHLLRHHPRKGLDFLIAVFNHSVDWYVHPRVRDALEPAWEIELTLPDGTTRTHWGNPRLWSLYRGTSIGPYVLQSLLMAFEKWLLDFAETHATQLDSVLVEILRRTDSAALAAVVASVATAWPHSSGEALLTLLSAPDYIAFDRSRRVGERHAATITGMFSSFRPENLGFEQERLQANRLPHRGHDLETAITNLQLGPLAARVHAILDRHLASLPPKSDQDEQDLIWRLSIHRMDIRQYTIRKTSEPEVSESHKNDTEAAKHYLELQAKAPDPDVQDMVNKNAAEFELMNVRLAVLLWGYEEMERNGGSHDSSRWREMLEYVRAMDRDTEQPDGSRDGPGLVAAACVRDHWEEMSGEQRDWCVSVVCSEVLRQADYLDPLNHKQSSAMSAEAASSSVIPLLLHRPLSPADMLLVRETFVAALTHPVDEMRWAVTWSVNAQFWATDRDLAMRCVNAIATEAELVDQALQVEREGPYHERRPLDAIIATAAIAVRNCFWKDEFAESAYETLDTSRQFGAHAAVRLLAILGQVPNEPAAIAAFTRATHTLVEWWDTDRDRGQRRHRDHRTENNLSQRLQEFLMQTTALVATEVLRPVLDAIDHHSREIYPIVDGLTAKEDRSPNTAQYWCLWNLFAEAVKRAKWSARMNGEHPTGGELLGAIFLTRWWKDDVRHWKSLEGHAHRVHGLFEALPPSSIVLDNYVRFLYHIGERSLPQAFVIVSNALRQGDAQAMLRLTNTVFLLEVLLQRHVYGRPLELKRDQEIRKAVLSLLDFLVEAGSSAAFRMRDDFVTPMSIA